MNNWTPTDWRKLIGLIFLGGGGVACTGGAFYALLLTAELVTRGRDPWPIVYQGGGFHSGILIVLTGFSAILGRRVFKLQVAGSTVESVGEDAATKIEDADGKGAA